MSLLQEQDNLAPYYPFVNPNIPFQTNSPPEDGTTRPIRVSDLISSYNSISLSTPPISVEPIDYADPLNPTSRPEEFYPEDIDDQTEALRVLTQSCGSGNVQVLKQVTKVWRLLPTCSVYKDVSDYVRNSMEEVKLSITNIFRVSRFVDEKKRFDEMFSILLWHGSTSDCIPGIVETGFRKGRGGMFGGGIYFADRIVKSAHYVKKSKQSGTVFFILAEVFPGKMYKAHHFHTSYKQPPKGFDSVKGNGSLIPDWKENRDYNGAIMPCGRSRRNTRHTSYDMPYNEYIVYDSDRVVVKFVVECVM